jgi:hypothetical protein
MSLAAKLKEQRDGLATEVETTLAAEDVTAEALADASAKTEEISALDERIATAEAVEARSAAITESRKESKVATFGGATITREAMTYDRDGRNSFVRDMIGAQLRNDSNSWDRLRRHQQEVAVETRDINRTDTSGGDFVPPIYLTNEYADFARAARVTADLMTNMALPAGTDSINVPAITTGSLTAFQTADNAATTTRDLVTSTVTAPVRSISGYENVSIQLVEQSPLAGGLDRMVFGDLLKDYALQLNTAVIGANDGTSGTINGALNAFTSINTTWTETTPSAVNGLASIAKAISKVVTNRYQDVEAIVMHPSTWYWLMASVDGQSRPLVVPAAAGPFNANGVVSNPGAAKGLVGSIHGVPVYVDATITKSYGAGTNQAPIFVGKFSDSYLFESGVKTRVLPDVLSANLTVRFQVYGYAALAHRYAKSLSVISGTGAVAPSGY